MEKDFYKQKSFLCKDGPARIRGEKHCNIKVCFACTDQDFLIRLLVKLSEENDCFWVKYSIKPRDGMYLGRCFFTNEEKVGQTWAKYHFHPKLFCNVQNDDFTGDYRDSAISWKLKDPMALE